MCVSIAERLNSTELWGARENKNKIKTELKGSGVAESCISSFKLQKQVEVIQICVYLCTKNLTIFVYTCFPFHFIFPFSSTYTNLKKVISMTKGKQ